jgi:DNA-binding SARP family transcriptional activator/Tfp pilus assembly protein PilF
MADRIEFSLLGPFVVRRGGELVEVPRDKPRAALAALLLAAGREVSIDALVDLLWGQQPPVSAREAAENCVNRLRRALGEDSQDRIRAHPGGYSIRIAPDELDVSRFEALAAAAGAAARGGAWDVVAADTRAALSLWRGDPLADAGSAALANRELPRLNELWLRVAETRADAELHLGRHADAVPELRRLVDAHPLRERLHVLLMLALYGCNRLEEALTAYQHAREILTTELGAAPGPELRELHHQILTGGQSLVAIASLPGEVVALDSESQRSGPGSMDVPVLVVPRQLPGVAAQFTGRVAELALLDELLEDADRDAPGRVVVSAIGGTAGVGKTALAVRWAHRVADRFPDGQLYVNLRGFDPSGSPAEPTEAIRGFLDALEVPAEQVPSDLASQAALFRSLLASRRILIVLDNARDEEQVRPLLPASQGCLVLVTSRNQMIGLAAANGARLFTLDVLDPIESCRMLATRLGGGRVGAEPEALVEIASLCAHLPLALAVTAARAAARPGFSLASLAAELRASHGRLNALDTGDPAASVRKVFSWSYRGLSEPAQRMFRLLGLHPGPDISAAASASLAGVDLDDAQRGLAELTRAHLLAEPAPGRYDFHDLLRVYAAEQAHLHDQERDRRAATVRVLDHYLHTACASDRLIKPLREVLFTLSPLRPGISPEYLPDRQQALAWFAAERPVLLAAVAFAAANGADDRTWQLPWAMSTFLDQQGHWHDLVAVTELAVAASERLGDTVAQSVSRQFLGLALARSGNYDQARGCYIDALVLSERLGDRVAAARIYSALCYIDARQGKYVDALDHAEQALDLCREVGHRPTLAEALNNVGACHAQLGDYEQARAFSRQALILEQELGDRYLEAHAWDSLGYVERQSGNLADAIDCYQRAVGLARELGDRLDEAEVVTDLGDVLHAAGSLHEARGAWQQALDILDSLRHPDADSVRRRLGLLSGAGGGIPSAG